jgi:hypothetical protein
MQKDDCASLRGLGEKEKVEEMKSGKLSWEGRDLKVQCHFICSGDRCVSTEVCSSLGRVWESLLIPEFLQFVSLRQSLHSVCFCGQSGQSGNTGLWAYLKTSLGGGRYRWATEITYSSRHFRRKSSSAYAFVSQYFVEYFFKVVCHKPLDDYSLCPYHTQRLWRPFMTFFLVVKGWLT